ncbi:unnamed protein product [Rhizophagus irregularis]|nr:unnamed protein product [Rhizophagus irregularis]
MSDNESMSSDNSDTELFNEEFLQNISDDSDSSSDDDCFEDTVESNSTLKLEILLHVILRLKKLSQSLCWMIYIEWMSLYGRLKLLEIKRMLKAKYNQKVYNKDLYKVIYKHHKTKAQESNDMSRLLVYLENCKENDSRWIIFKDWDHKINTLTKIFWMIPKQIET